MGVRILWFEWRLTAKRGHGAAIPVLIDFRQAVGKPLQGWLGFEVTIE